MEWNRSGRVKRKFWTVEIVPFDINLFGENENENDKFFLFLISQMMTQLHWDGRKNYEQVSFIDGKEGRLSGISPMPTWLRSYNKSIVFFLFESTDFRQKTPPSGHDITRLLRAYLTIDELARVWNEHSIFFSVQPHRYTVIQLYIYFYT